MQTAAADGAIHLLGGHAGDQAAAARIELEVDAELITAHQAARGVQDRQFATAVFTLLSTQQFERSRAAPLVHGACVSVRVSALFKAQVAAAMPGIEALHPSTLGARGAITCSNHYQVWVDCWAGSGRQRSRLGRHRDRAGTSPGR